MKKILRNVVGLAALFISGATFAQEYVHQVIFLNEGQYDYTNQVQVTPVTVGAYNLASETYTDFDTIWDVQFGSDVLVDGDFIYVAADSVLVMYNKYDHQFVNSTVIPGMRKLAVWNNHLLVTRGNQTPYNSYFQVYDKTTLNFVYELDTQNGPSASSSAIAVHNDTAYIAVNNSFEWGNYVGKLGIVDLNNQTYEAEVDLGADAINPENVMVNGDKLFTLNNKNFDGSSITVFDIPTRSHSTTNVAINSSCGTSVEANNFIYFMEYSLGKLARYDLNQGNVSDTIQDSFAYYGMLEDHINGLLYVTNTDYVSYGEAFIMDYDGNRLDTFEIGVSAGNMALDIRSTPVGLDENLNNLLSVYPNPVNEVLNITGLSDINANAITISDIAGRLVYNQSINAVSNNYTIDIEGFNRGVYLLTVNTSNGLITKKIVKR